MFFKLQWVSNVKVKTLQDIGRADGDCILKKIMVAMFYYEMLSKGKATDAGCLCFLMKIGNMIAQDPTYGF